MKNIKSVYIALLKLKIIGSYNQKYLKFKYGMLLENKLVCFISFIKLEEEKRKPNSYF